MSSEFIEILSPNTEAQLKAIMPLVEQLANNIKTINGYKASSTPSGADKGIQVLNTAYKDQGTALKTLADRINEVSKNQNSLNSRTKESVIAEDNLTKAIKKRFDIAEKEANSASAKKALQDRETALKKLNELTKEATALEEKRQNVLNKGYDSDKELNKIAKKYEDLNLRIKESSASLLKLDQQIHKTGESSPVPKLQVVANRQKVDEKIAEQTEKERIAAEKLLQTNKKLNDAYGQLTKQRNDTARALQNSIIETGKYSEKTKQLQKDFDGLNKKVGQADKAIGKFSQANSGIKALTSSVSTLMGAFGIGTGIYLAIDIAKNIYETTKALQSMDLALKMVSETELDFAKNQQFITEVADKWGLEIKTLQQTYTQFYTASKGLLSDESIKTTFEGIAKAGSIMGLSLEKQQAAFYAIDQMMSKGTVTAEELKKQLGNAMPGAIKAAAMAYMELHPQIKSIQEAEKALYEDMKKGAIDSATYVPLIAKNFQILYGIESLNSVHTMQAAQNRLQNSWTEWVRGLSSGGTGLKIIVSVMESLAKNLSTVISTLAIGATGWLAYKTAVMLASAQTKLLALTTTTATVATAEQTVVTGFQTAAQVANATATTAATTAWQRFTLALKANALGLAILAIGAAIVIFNHFNKSIEETTAEIKEANNAFITNREVVMETVIENKKLINRYAELTEKIKEVGGFTKLTKEEQLEYNDALAKLSKKVPNAITGVNNYGVAISLNTEILRKYNVELQNQLYYEKKIALAKDRELLPQQQINVAEKQAELNETLRFQKAGALKQGSKDIQLAIAEQQLALSIAKNELTMTAARIKSMNSATEAEKKKVLDDKKIKEEEIKNVAWYDKKISELEKTKEGFTKRGEGLEYQKQLKQLQKERAYILGEEEKVKKSSIKADKDAAKEREQLLKDEYDLKISNLERDKEIISDELKNKQDSLEYKQALTDLYGLKEIQIAQAIYDEKIRLAKGNDALEQIALNEKNTAIENAYAESLERQQKIKEDYLKNEKDKTKEWYDKNPPFFMQSPAQKDALDTENKKAEDALRESYKARIKLFNEYVGAFADKSGFSESFNFFTEINVKTGKTMWEQLIEDAEDGKVAFTDVFMAMSTVAQDTMNLIAEASNQRFEREFANLEKQKEVALGFAGDSASAREKVEEDYLKRKQKLEEKQFKSKQKMALANIAIDTAQAIMQIWSHSPDPTGISQGLMTGIISALAAIQAGIVVTQKYQGYWKGTDNAEAGLAWTNERGAEIVTDKHGHIKDFGSDKGAKLTMMEKGDKVYTAQQTKKMMFDDSLNSILTDNGIGNAPKVVVNSGMSKSDMEEVMLKTLGSMPMQSTIIDKNGLQHIITNGHSKTVFLSNRVSGIGLKV